MSMLLAIDTSTSYASVATVRDGELLAELTWHVGRRHSQELIARLDDVMRLSHATPADLTAVAVALGPGSFNGVRVGVAATKSLAFGLGLPLYGACTLDVIAMGHEIADGLICAVLEAGRGELYRACYVSQAYPLGERPGTIAVPVHDTLTRVTEYAIVTPAQLAADIEGAVLLCGEWRPETRAELAARLGQRARFAVPPGVRRSGWLATIAWRRHLRGAGDEPATIEPIYVRRPNITQQASLQHGDARQSGPDDRSAAAGGEGEVRALRH